MNPGQEFLLILILIIIAIFFISFLLYLSIRRRRDDYVKLIERVIVDHMDSHEIQTTSVDRLKDLVTLKPGGVYNADSSKYVLHSDDKTNSSSGTENMDLRVLLQLCGEVDYIFFMDRKGEYLESYISRSEDTRSRKDLFNLLQHDLHLKRYITKEAMRIILRKGFPHSLENGCILDIDWFLYLVMDHKLPNFPIPRVVPKYISPRSSSSSSESKIPKIIYQSFEYYAVPQSFYSGVETWIELNPEFEYRYFNNSERRRFIRDHFDKEILEAYDSLIPGAYQCDLWRLCALYLTGGYYVDVKMGAIVPISEINIEDKDVELIIVKECPQEKEGIFNAFMAATPNNPLIWKNIQELVRRVKRREYGKSGLWPTGPMCTWSAMAKDLDVKTHLSLQDGVRTYHLQELEIDMKILIMEHHREKQRVYCHDKELIKTRNDPSSDDHSMLRDICGIGKYGELWKERRIYL